MTKELAVILVNYNGFEDTLECVTSLFSSDQTPGLVIIVDNNSPDQSGDRLFSRYSEDERVYVIQLEDNLGFGAANNAAMQWAFESGYHYALLLNNDTVVSPETLKVLLERADDKSVIVPVIAYYYTPDKIWYGGGYYDVWGAPRHEDIGKPLANGKLNARETEWATGCCMLVPKRAFLATKGFDERYFLYWEDVDWSIRLRSGGYRIILEPKALLWHKVSMSTGGKNSPHAYYYSLRNKLYINRKFSMGLRMRLWTYASVIQGVLSRKEKYAYAIDAWRDYRKGQMGGKVFEF